MEQQNKIQSVEVSEVAIRALGKAEPNEPHEVSLLDEKVPYVFVEGVYKAEGVEGSFMSIDTLERAWKAATRARKLAEAQTLMRSSKISVGKTEAQQKALKNKAISERIKWQEAK